MTGRNSLNEKQAELLRRIKGDYLRLFLPFTLSETEDAAERLVERGYLERMPRRWYSPFYTYELTQKGREASEV